MRFLDPSYPVEWFGLSVRAGHTEHRTHWHAAHGNAGYVCSCGEEVGCFCFSYVLTDELAAWFEAAPPCPACPSGATR